MVVVTYTGTSAMFTCICLPIGHLLASCRILTGLDLFDMRVVSCGLHVRVRHWMACVALLCALGSVSCPAVQALGLAMERHGFDWGHFAVTRETTFALTVLLVAELHLLLVSLLLLVNELGHDLIGEHS